MKNTMRLVPIDESDDGSFHEVWWNSIAGGDAPSGKLRKQLHEVWQWSGDFWMSPDMPPISPELAWQDGWRYVRPIKLLDGPRFDGEEPKE